MAVIALFCADQMDERLNYSMKRKVNTDRIPLWFPSNRATESALGPSLEQPNKGTYLPAFVCCCVTYALTIIAVIMLIVVHYCFSSSTADKICLSVVYILVFFNNAVVSVLATHYHKKYYENQPYWIGLINAEIARRNGESENNDQI